MESNITEQDFSSGEARLAEPHFDEATLLSARPVVPLERVPAKSRLTRNWIFALALTGALLLGMTATAVYYSRLLSRDEQSAAVDDMQPSATPETLSAGSAGIAEPGEVAESKIEQPVVDSSVSTEPRSRTSKPAANTIPNRPAPRTPAAVNREDRDDEIRQERKAERREARERNRELRRERRATRSSDDLLRIREIFEGPRRP